MFKRVPIIRYVRAQPFSHDFVRSFGDMDVVFYRRKSNQDSGEYYFKREAINSESPTTVVVVAQPAASSATVNQEIESLRLQVAQLNLQITELKERSGGGAAAAATSAAISTNVGTTLPIVRNNTFDLCRRDRPAVNDADKANTTTVQLTVNVPLSLTNEVTVEELGRDLATVLLGVGQRGGGEGGPTGQCWDFSYCAGDLSQRSVDDLQKRVSQLSFGQSDQRLEASLRQ